MIGCVLVGGGLALSETLTNDLIISAAPAARAGAASAISETGYELGGALGTAIMGSVATAVYRAGLPVGTPDEARETLGGATAAAGRLPADRAGPLLDAARGAFVQGMHVTAWLGVALLVYTGLQALFLLKGLSRVCARSPSCRQGARDKERMVAEN